MYDKHISLLVGSTNVYVGIFYQIYLLPQLTITFIFIFRLLLWNYGDDVIGCWINSTSLSGYEKVCCACLDEDSTE